MSELGEFFRIFLYVPEEPQFKFRLRVCPDSGHAGGLGVPAIVVSLKSADQLELCFREFRVTGYSLYRDEASGVPTFEYRECTPDDILSAIADQPLSRLAHLTLIVAETSTIEMRERVAALRAKAGNSLEIVDAA